MYYKIHTDKTEFEHWLKTEMTTYKNDVGVMLHKGKNVVDIYVASSDEKFLTQLTKKYNCVEVDNHPPAALECDYSYLGDTSFFDTNNFL